MSLECAGFALDPAKVEDQVRFLARTLLEVLATVWKGNARRALFGWLTDKETEKWAPATKADLPAQVQGLMAYRQADTAEAQALILSDLSVRWDLLADAAKGPLVWKAIARQMGPQALRMNLNTLLRHEVLGNGNPDSVVIPFDTRAYGVRVDPGDTILSLSERLARYGGGGTDCSIPLREANTKHRKRAFAGCVLVSDNESWVHRNRAFAYGRHGATGVMDEWQTFVANQKRLGVSSPKLVCIDIQPYGSTQAPERAARQGRSHLGYRDRLDSGNTQLPVQAKETAHDILNIGGFSDAVFNVVASYLGDDAGRFVAEVESIEL